MRSLSATIQKVLNSEYLEVKDLVELKIPAYSYYEGSEIVTLPEILINLALSEVSVDGKLYSPTLRQISQIKYSLGSAPDNASITVENADRDFGKILLSNRKLDNTRCTIKRAFKTEVGWESDTLFADAYVRDIKINGKEVSLSLISEMSRKGASVAERTVTQRCYFIFKDPKTCKWTTEQPGDALVCDKGEDTPNGCKAHGNLPQFGAVPAFAITENSFTGGYDGFTNNFPNYDTSSWCVTPETNVLVCDEDFNKYIVKARNLKENDMIVSFDLFGHPYTTNILKVLKGKTTRLYTIHTENYSLTCTGSHPIIRFRGDKTGVSASNLKVGDNVLTYNRENLLADTEKIVAIDYLDTEQEVLTLKLKDYYTFCCGNEKNGGIVSHNMKEMSRQYNFSQIS